MLVWIDTDLALGAASGDVDDGFALAALLVDPDVEVLGLSTVSGNTDADTARHCLRELVAEVPRRPGAESLESRICPPAEVPRRMAALPAGAKLLALGPLTNVAAAVRLDASLPARVELATVVTIRRPWRHPWLRFYCLNSRADRDAARAVAAPRWASQRIFPLDVVQQLRFDTYDLDRLASLGPLGAHLARHSRRWLRQAGWRYRRRSFPAWDLVAALATTGRLPDARFDERGRLEAFDAPAAKEEFLGLVAGGRATLMASS